MDLGALRGEAGVRQGQRRAGRRPSTASVGVLGPTTRSCRSGARSPSRSSIHHTATPNQADVSQGSGRSHWPARSRTSTWTAAVGWTPDSTSPVSRGGFRHGGPSPELGNRCAAGRQQVEGAHCTGQNVVGDRDRERGHLHRGRSATRAMEPAAGPVRLDLQPVRHPGPPSSTATGTSRTPPARATACTPCCPGCGRDVAGGARSARLRAVGVKASWPLLQQGDRGPGSDGRAVPPPRRGTSPPPRRRVSSSAVTDAAVRRFQAATGAEEVNGLPRRGVLAGAGPHHAARDGWGRRPRRRCPCRRPRRRGCAGPRDDARVAAAARHRGRPREPDVGPANGRMSSPLAESQPPPGESSFWARRVVKTDTASRRFRYGESSKRAWRVVIFGTVSHRFHRASRGVRRPGSRTPAHPVSEIGTASLGPRTPSLGSAASLRLRTTSPIPILLRFQLGERGESCSWTRPKSPPPARSDASVRPNRRVGSLSGHDDVTGGL